MTDSEVFRFGAALTGDFIRSRRHSSDLLDLSMMTLKIAATDIGTMTGAPCRFERSRGDGWQMFLPDGRHGLRAAMIVFAALERWDGLPSRIALGLGGASIPASGGLAAAHGPAFVSAGDLLDAMDRNTRLQLPELPGPCGAAFSALVMFLDREARSWTPTQAEALYETLCDPAQTQDRIARKLGVTRQAVQSRLAGTALDALQSSLTAFETALQSLWHEGRP